MPGEKFGLWDKPSRTRYIGRIRWWLVCCWSKTSNMDCGIGKKLALGKLEISNLTGLKRNIL